MNSRFLFRCDSTAETGYGHFSRCLNLARTLREAADGVRPAFWGDYNAFARSMLERYAIERLELDAAGFDANAVEACRRLYAGYDAVVVDSYLLDQAHVDGIAGCPGMLALFDDTHSLDLSRVDLSICFRAGTGVAAGGARRQAVGLEYLIVKPELAAVRRRKLQRQDVAIRDILVFLTGSELPTADVAGVVAAAKLPGVAVSCIIPDGKPLENVDGVAWIRPGPDIEDFFSGADLVISGGGLVKYESAYCTIPNAALSLTGLQHEDTRKMAELGLTLDLGSFRQLDADRVRETLASFLHDPEAIARQRDAFRTLIADDSTHRLARMLLYP